MDFNMPERMLSLYRRIQGKCNEISDEFFGGKSQSDLNAHLSEIYDLLDKFNIEYEVEFKTLLDQSAKAILVATRANIEKVIETANMMIQDRLEIMHANESKIQPSIESQLENLVLEGKKLSEGQTGAIPKQIGTDPRVNQTNPFLVENENEIGSLNFPNLTVRESETLKKFLEDFNNQPDAHSTMVSAPMRKRLEKEGITIEVEPTRVEPTRNEFPKIELKLDKVQLPTFNGSLVDWISFRDQFRDLVHFNPNLSDMIKFHQLRTHLSGVAFETIRGYSFTASNYEAAWKDLNQRFNRVDNIIDEFIHRFISMPHLGDYPTALKYTTMIDITKQMLQTLPNFGIDITNWDPIVKYVILAKMDDETKRAWKTQIGKLQQVSLVHLMEFLETRVFMVNDRQESTRKRENIKLDVERQQRKGIKVNHVTEQKCFKCNEAHYIYQCGEMLSLSAPKRTEIIKGLGLCFKCLRKHDRNQCTFKNCPNCNGPHNTLLCYKGKRVDGASGKNATQSQGKDPGPTQNSINENHVNPQK